MVLATLAISHTRRFAGWPSKLAGRFGRRKRRARTRHTSIITIISLETLLMITYFLLPLLFANHHLGSSFGDSQKTLAFHSSTNGLLPVLCCAVHWVAASNLVPNRLVLRLRAPEDLTILQAGWFGVGVLKSRGIQAPEPVELLFLALVQLAL